jgi:DNA-binding transcriptional ArsR family regulator
MADAEITTIQVEGSTALELFWLLHRLSSDEEQFNHPLYKNEPLRNRALGFWGDEPVDDCGCVFDEVLVLADLGGAFLGTDPETMDSFLDRLPQIAPRRYPEPQLATERPLFKSRILSHLERLRTDAGVRASYQQLLRDVWAEVRGAWVNEGRNRVDAACSRLRTRVEREGGFAGLVQTRHLVLRHEFRRMAEEAMDEGRLLLSPSFFGRGHGLVFDLPSVFLVGVAADPPPRAEELRQHTEWAARELKVLADGTRLAILAYLADTPASVTELANAFSLAQPTVSAHLRQLREARMVAPVSEGGKTRYEVSREEIERVLVKTRDSVLGPG